MTIPQNNLFDDLIDQIDDGVTIDICGKCVTQTKNLIKISCNHFICLDCIEILIDDEKYDNCPMCNILLTKNLHKIYADFLADPILKLQHYFGINIGDILWYYSGNGHNWLYTKDVCNQLNTAFEKYDVDGISSTTKIQITVGNAIQTYVVDFVSSSQYSENTPNKQRNISSFKLKSLSDLKKYKIIGVSGKLL
jgi:hypothetical protein